MKPHTLIDGSSGLVILTGQFTFEAHRGLKDAFQAMLDNPAVLKIALDLAQVTYMDSSSLGILLLLKEKAEAKARKVVLRNPNATVLKTLQVVQFNQIFQIENN